MKYLGFSILFLLSVGCCAQDSVLNNRKWRTYFENNSYKENEYKLTGIQIEANYGSDRFYPALLVFREPGFVSVEHELLFLSVADLIDPLTPLRVKNRLQGGTYNVNKEDLEVFVFDNHLFRRFAAGPYNLDSPWGIVFLNGPFLCLKTFRPNPYSKKYDEDFRTLKYNETYQQYSRNEKTNGGDPNEPEGNIRFKQRMIIDFKGYDEMIAKIENDMEGYRQEDRLKMLLEYNEWIKQNEPERYRAAVFPKTYYKKPK
jgi:hypothetical protein